MRDASKTPFISLFLLKGPRMQVTWLRMGISVPEASASSPANARPGAGLPHVHPASNSTPEARATIGATWPRGDGGRGGRSRRDQIARTPARLVEGIEEPDRVPRQLRGCDVREAERNAGLFKTQPDLLGSDTRQHTVLPLGKSRRRHHPTT